MEIMIMEMKRILWEQQLTEFKNYLIEEEKSTATVDKYLRDVRAFFVFVDESVVSKEITVEYKKYLQVKGYALRSINSMLASVNSFLDFM